MKILTRQFADRKFAMFLFVSTIAAGVNFFSRMLLGLTMSYGLSIVVAYIFGIITAYILCRLYVFKSEKNSPIKEMAYFIAVNAFAILLTLVVSLVFANYLLLFIHQQFLREEVAHFIGIMAPAFTSYLGHKHLSFK
jgi:putative flippase GtrA